MKKINLALLSGGISSEREVSINSGNQVYDALDKNKYNIMRYDPKTDLEKLVADAPQIDAGLTERMAQCRDCSICFISLTRVRGVWAVPWQ